MWADIYLCIPKMRSYPVTEEWEKTIQKQNYQKLASLPWYPTTKVTKELRIAEQQKAEKENCGSQIP